MKYEELKKLSTVDYESEIKSYKKILIRKIIMTSKIYLMMKQDGKRLTS
ncbi:MAG: hypothetical protein L6V85_08065 [Clostridiales bacterium]|nr:MAG: hypothetical protein L6V85_08065 [Clostridiales bacterium]